MDGQPSARLRSLRVVAALSDAAVETVGPSLLEAAGLPAGGPRTPDYFSPGVDVEVFAPEAVR